MEGTLSGAWTIEQDAEELKSGSGQE
jgi:hypothetical protein